MNNNKEWKKKKLHLNFNDEDIKNLNCIHMSYKSPLSEMAKSLFRFLGVNVVEIDYEISSKKIDLNPEQLKILKNQEKAVPKNHFEFIKITLEKSSLPLSKEQEKALKNEIKNLYDKAYIKSKNADMVFLSGNSKDVPRAFYDENLDDRVIENKNPLDIRAYIEKDVILPMVLEKNLPLFGTCYGAQIAITTGFGKLKHLKGAKLYPHLPDEDWVKINHRVDGYCGLEKKQATNFQEKHYEKALKGEVENPFVKAGCIHKINVIENTILDDLCKKSFIDYNPKSNKFCDVSSHHQSLIEKTLPDVFEISARAEGGVVEAVEIKRDKNGKKIISFGLFTQFHPETGAGRTQNDIKTNLKNPQSSPSGIAISIAQAQIFMAIFNKRWQEAGYKLEDAPTYKEILAFEEGDYDKLG